MIQSIEETLEERGKQHGDFHSHAEIEMELRMLLHANSSGLSDVQYIGMNMILHKVARIMNRGAAHADSWHDIAGYATLVERDMIKEAEDKLAGG